MRAKIIASVCGGLLILVIGAVWALVGNPMTLMSLAFHGNTHSSGFKQGYLFSVSEKQDAKFVGVTKSYKLEFVPIMAGGTGAAGKEGQTSRGETWQVNFKGDKEGDQLYEYIDKNSAPDSQFRVYYNELTIAITDGDTAYRAARVRIWDPVERAWAGDFKVTATVVENE